MTGEPRARAVWHAPLRAAAICCVAAACTTGPTAADFEQQRRELAALKEEVARLRAQSEEVARLSAKGESLAAMPPRLDTAALAEARGAGAAPVAAAPPPQQQPAAVPPPQPVGQPPAAHADHGAAERVVGAETAPSDTASLLTRPGTLILDPSVELGLSTSNRLVYRGTEIVPGLQVGYLEATSARQTTVTSSIGGRLGLAPRWEADLRIPFVYRDDEATYQVEHLNQTVANRVTLRGAAIGDVEAGVRYQINEGSGGWPFFIAGLRAKAPTGVGPYDIRRDEDGVARGITTGSGFWALSGELSAILPSDPAVLFGTVGYSWNPAYSVGRDFGGTRIGRVDPGDALNFSAGLGFAVNPELSFTLGYKHTYLWPTEVETGGQTIETRSLHIGASMLGLSYRVSDTVSVNASAEFGVTRDAPDLRAILRVPVSVSLW